MSEYKTDKSMITVDPGVNTGWVYWLPNSYLPCGSGVLRCAPLIKNKMEKLADMWHKFHFVLIKYRPSIVVIEGVQLWASSLESVTSAKRGDSFFLSYIIGGYAHEAYKQSIEFVILTPNEWKGQQTKEAIDYKINATLSNKYRDHESDAVGMGLALRGKI